MEFYKDLLYIYLELFTIRYYRKYNKDVMQSFRDFIITKIKYSDGYLEFRRSANASSTELDSKEFACVQEFLAYILHIYRVDSSFNLLFTH